MTGPAEVRRPDAGLLIVIGIGRHHRALTGDGNAPNPIG
jgi:hypothetical protein